MRPPLSKHIVFLLSIIAQIALFVLLLNLPISVTERFLLFSCFVFMILGHYSHFISQNKSFDNQIHVIWSIASAMLSSGATCLLVMLTDGNIVLSGAIVGSLLGLLPQKKIQFLEKNIQLPGYTGAFVGMSAPTLFTHWAFSLFAGALAGLIYVWGEHSLLGVGGRLGAFAFIAVGIIFFVQFLIL